MSAPSRTAQFAKIQKVLKKHYKVVTPDANRSVLEHLLFACCLENAHYEVAEESFLALVHNFFDWNEVRVSTVRELSEVMGRLPEPMAAANRVKQSLQSVFEANYSFDLEELRKVNLGPAVERLMKLKGSTPFTTAYVVQAALNGHSIPLDAGTLGALRVLDVISDEEVKTGVVAGLERAIAKPKGVEFGSLVHQLGAEVTASPYAPALRQILLEINPEARARLPKRRKVAEETPPPPEEKPAAEKEALQAAAPPETVEAAPKRAPAKKKPRETKDDTAKRKTEAKPAAERKKETPPKKAAAEAKDAAAKKKSTAAKKGASAKKKDVAEKDKSHADSGKKQAGKEPGSSGLAKRKPR